MPRPATRAKRPNASASRLAPDRNSSFPGAGRSARRLAASFFVVSLVSLAGLTQTAGAAEHVPKLLRQQARERLLRETQEHSPDVLTPADRTATPALPSDCRGTCGAGAKSLISRAVSAI